MIRLTFAALLATALVSATVHAVNPVQWDVNRTLTKPATTDALSSPTAIDLGLAAYRVSYSVRELAAITTLGDLNLRDSLGTLVRGEQIVTTFPTPVLNRVASESASGTQVRLNLSVDAQGRPQIAWTEAVYGVLQIGTTYPVNGIRSQIDFDVVGYQFGDYSLNTRFGLGDFQRWRADFGTTTQRTDGNRNGLVDAADYTVWRDKVTSNFGDLNLDGAVNGSDYTLWRLNFGSPPTLALDANENEAIDAADYTVWRDRVTLAAAAVPSAVPEPAAVTIAMLTVLVSLSGRARRSVRSRS
jgi:hypothetical protein